MADYFFVFNLGLKKVKVNSFKGKVYIHLIQKNSDRGITFNVEEFHNFSSKIKDINYQINKTSTKLGKEIDSMCDNKRKKHEESYDKENKSAQRKKKSKNCKLLQTEEIKSHSYGVENETPCSFSSSCDSETD